MKVLLHTRLVVFPSFLPFRTAACLISHLSPCRGALLFLSLTVFPLLSLQGPRALPGERLPSVLPRLFGGEPEQQVSAQNKHSWLSYEPPEG